ncbi:hypothetical protein [Phenylobacterium sp.]|uniref:hypothetical protein n=1 Tax=Phenylobacterium sp. TaxID=1871053 RepID=UPI002F40AB9D
MQASFDPLLRRLLDGGVRRKPARRYLAELKDHLDDLIAEERRAMSDPQLAESRALCRLGSFDMLADAMIERREFQSWGHKAPFAAYLVAPAAALAAVTALTVVGVVMTVKQTHAAGAGPVPGQVAEFATGMMFFANVILPVLLAWALGAAAFRNRSALLWPACGIVALAALGSVFHVSLTLPSAMTRGEVAISPDGFMGFSAMLAAAALPYAGLLFWRAARERQAA